VWLIRLGAARQGTLRPGAAGLGSARQTRQYRCGPAGRGQATLGPVWRGRPWLDPDGGRGWAKPARGWQGAAWLGSDGGQTRRTRQDGTWPGPAWYGSARRPLARSAGRDPVGMARTADVGRFGVEWHGWDGPGRARLGQSWAADTDRRMWRGMARLDGAWRGMAWTADTAWLGQLRHGVARLGAARHGQGGAAWNGRQGMAREGPARPGRHGRDG
jgi:hypothetical protein